MTTTSGAPIAFAHRGGRAHGRENTLATFEEALRRGATGLESDAWVTGDGIVVLDHDGVTGPVWRHRAVSVQPRADLPRHIPALADLYERCGTDYELSLDVKDPAALEAIVAVARAAGAADRLWLCHHDWRPMAAWRRSFPEVHLVESTNLAWMHEGLAARLSALASAGIDALNLHRSQWDAGVMHEVRAVGRLGFAWDAQSSEDLVALCRMGVDGLYSDHVDRMVDALRAVRAGPDDRPR